MTIVEYSRSTARRFVRFDKHAKVQSIVYICFYTWPCGYNLFIYGERRVSVQYVFSGNDRIKLNYIILVLYLQNKRELLFRCKYYSVRQNKITFNIWIIKQYITNMRRC